MMKVGGMPMVGSRATRALFAAAMFIAPLGASAYAASCGNTAAGFEDWKRAYASEARARGIGGAGAAALMTTNYSHATISADRGQKSFKLSLEEFLAKRGGNAIVARGRQLKRSEAAMFASIEQRYGVPPGPLLAIWGMETGFGRTRGNQNALSAVATLAYDCRRTEFFSDQLDAALKLVDRGILSANSRGSMHGEVGHTQFLPKNVLLYSSGSLDNVETALAATANFLKAHGWRPHAGYQPGEPNFAAIQAWNAATVYERAIAILGKQIDSGGVAAID
jgi:membrane-bound lytic murein transglycosylase B